jgi:5-carboxymethyl-2-hydroxymuconate isomerase
MTLRDVQDEAKQKGLPWTTAKGFRTSAPVSDIVLKHEIINPDNINFMGFVNGELKQSVNTSEMIISINEILKYIDSIFSLQSGDLIYTGTPAGVGKVKSGDLLEANLENLVQLKVRVS